MKTKLIIIALLIISAVFIGGCKQDWHECIYKCEKENGDRLCVKWGGEVVTPGSACKNPEGMEIGAIIGEYCNGVCR